MKRFLIGTLKLTALIVAAVVSRDRICRPRDGGAACDRNGSQKVGSGMSRVSAVGKMRSCIGVLTIIAPLALIGVPGMTSASEADAWAKTSGALMGMAAACGYEISDQWIKAVVRKRRAVALGEADFAASTETFQTYTTRAYVMQTTNPNMSCGQVLDMMRNSERQMR